MKGDKDQNKGFNKVLNSYRTKLVLKHCKGKTCLEIGCGEGQMTKSLEKRFNYVRAVDGDKSALKKIKLTMKLHKLCMPLEHMTYVDMKFDTIVCTQFLEHVKDPVKVLKIIKEWGHDKSVFIFSVPNAQSYNRTIGVEAGMLKHITDLHAGDKKAGHKRVYTFSTFLDDLYGVFHVKHIETSFYKPFSNSMMEKLPPSIIKKCMKMKMDDCGGEIFAVCTT